MSLQSFEIRVYALGIGEPLVVLPFDAVALEDFYETLPLGVYSALRTWDHTRLLALERHMDRTDRSMASLGWPDQLDRDGLTRTIAEACRDFPAPDARVRFDVLATSAPFLGTDERTLVSLTPYVPVDRHLLENGVAVGFAQDLRRESPRIKSADFVIARKPYPLGGPKAYERLLLDEQGCILEGTSSNFYALIKGSLHTAGAGVLQGITQRIVLDLATERGVPIVTEPVHPDELSHATEAFLTSSIRGLVPIVRVGEQVIGSGRPGPLGLGLLADYLAYAERNAREPSVSAAER